MIVRPARTRDAVAIAGIFNRVVRDTLVTFTTQERSPAGIAEDIAARGSAFQVAESQTRVVGFATYGRFRTGPGYDATREHTIMLDPQAQGQGGGRRLMEALEQVARADGVHVLVAGISAENPAAVSFHSALGFTQVGRMPEVGYKWGRRLDLVLMQKILRPE